MAISFLPVQRFTIITSKSTGDVIMLLRDSINHEENRFYGSMEHNLFSVTTRKGLLSNNLNVVLHGEILEKSGKTLIEVRSQYDFLTKSVFMVLGVMMLIYLIRPIFIDHDPSEITTMIIAMVFWYILMISLFALETWRAKKELLSVVKGEITP